MSVPSLSDVKAGGKALLAAALAVIEAGRDRADVARLLSSAHAAPKAQVLGLTGPPGVGKSTLIAALIRHYRRAGLSVGVIAVDPSSRASGGALLGDRTRFVTDPGDAQVFIRSLAARDRLGGLAALAFPTAILMRACFDRVIVETVGVGQSETDVARIADSAIFCIQPASGDSLQFMKAGIMEVPDIFVVAKADLGPVAERAQADLEGALSLAASGDEEWQPPVLSLSAARGQGIEALVAAIDAHFAHLSASGTLSARRAAQTTDWLHEEIRLEAGRRGLADFLCRAEEGSPFAALSAYLLSASQAGRSTVKR